MSTESVVAIQLQVPMMTIHQQFGRKVKWPLFYEELQPFKHFICMTSPQQSGVQSEMAKCGSYGNTQLVTKYEKQNL